MASDLVVYSSQVDKEACFVFEVDAMACATGFDTSFLPASSITGRNDFQLGDVWDHHASAYMSHSVLNFPNYFFVGIPIPPLEAALY